MDYKGYVLKGEIYRKHCEGCNDLVSKVFHGHRKTDMVTVYCRAENCEVPRKEGYFKPIIEKERLGA